MPLDRTRPLSSAPLRVQEPLDPTVMETMGAAWRQDNLIGSILSSEELGRMRNGSFYDIEPNYDVFDDIEGYEDHAERFEDVFNPTAAAGVKAQIDREIKDRQILAASGWLGTGATIGATLLDPTMLLPGGALVKAGRLGYAASRSALKVGVAAGAATAVQEAGLQATQETRSVSESALNVGGSILGGAVLGGAMARVMTHAQIQHAGKLLMDARQPDFDVATDVLHEELQEMVSAGAAAAKRDTLDDLTVAGRAGSAVARSTAQLNPLLRTLTSPSKAVRAISSQMMENPVYLKKNLRGEGDIAAETAMHEFARGSVVRALDEQTAAYREARKTGLSMTRTQFREEIGRAMRRGDRSNVPGVERAAKAWRENVIEPLKQRAIENNMLPADVHVTTADSYLSRLWKRPAIEANEAEFRGIVRKWLSGQVEKEIARAAGKVDRRVGNLQRERSDLEMGILRRGENLRRRTEDGEILPDTLDEESVVGFVKRVQAGERPQMPETLSQWVKRQRGGIYDPTGDLAGVMPDAKSIPGLLRKSRKGPMNDRGGDGLDDIALRAWEQGFFGDAKGGRQGGVDRSGERPSIRDFLDALDRDLRGESVVRFDDLEAAAVADDFNRTLEALDRAGVDFNKPMFGTSDAMRDIAAKVNKVLDDLDRERIGRLDQSIADAKQRGSFDFLNDADRDDYIEGIIDDIYANVTGRNADGDIPSNLMIGARGPLKERTFNIPDEFVEKFLESDVELVGRRYARVMAADIELTERFGSPDLKSALDGVREEYNDLRRAVEADKNLAGPAKAKELDRLNKREKADLRDLQGVRDLLRGHYRPEVQHTNFARVLNGFQTFNFMRALGGVVISSLTDTVRPAMVHGMTAYMRDGVKPLLTNLNAVKLSAAEAKAAGAIAERAMAARLATLAELTDPYSMRSPFERFLDNAAVGFTQMTGLLHWTDFQKVIASTMTQNRILKNAELAAAKGFDALPAKERAYMGYLGIGEGRAEGLGKLFSTHGDTLDGVRVANTDAWGDDPAAANLRRAYRSAINKDVDSTIVTKGVGDVPLFANTPLGRAVIQFRSFAMASNQRVLIRGLQEDTSRFVGGVLGMTAIGMFIYWLKQIESGREVSDNPGTWVVEGLDRSGVFSLGFEVNNTLEKIGAPGVYTGAAAAFPDALQSQPASRFASRNAPSALAGPTFGALTDTSTLMGAGFANLRGAASGESPGLTAGDIGAMRRMTPFASLPYWRWLIDGMVVPELKREVAN